MTLLPSSTQAGRDVPAIGQVEGDAGLGVGPKLHVAQCSQADVEDDDKGHPQVQNKRKLLWMLHLIFERQNLKVKEVEKEEVVRSVAPHEEAGFPLRHRHPSQGGPGSGRATLLFIFFHSLLPGVPYSGWTNEYIRTQSSRLSVVHGAVGARDES